MKLLARKPATKFLLVPALIASLALSAQAQPSPTGFFFHDGDRAMITGDSITEQRQYSTLVESYVLSRFPKWRITFRNTGWSGDTMNLRTRGGLDNGFTRDLAAYNPTAVTIDFGMNDVRAGDGGYETYLASGRTLADKFKAIGTRVAFVTSSAEERYEAGQPAGSAMNVMLRKYSEGLKGVAAEKGALFVDELNPMIKTIEEGRAGGVLGAAGDPRLVPDGVHGNWAGHLVMAAHILKGLKAHPLVSAVELNAKTGRAQTANAAVTAVKNEATISFVRTDGALPWPIPNDAAFALKIPGFNALEDLSRYTLKVSNLNAASYDVAIDGQKVGTYKREELAAGVNFSQNAGPISVQCQQLFDKITEKNNQFYNQWRGIKLAGGFPGWFPAAQVEAARAAEVQRLDVIIAANEAEIDALRQPKPHTWTLTPAI